MTNHTQPIYTHGEDLPLFTGQPVNVQPATFTPKTAYRQTDLFKEQPTMKTYLVTVDANASLPLPSNAHIVDTEGDGKTDTVTIEVNGNYTHFEQQLDTNGNVYSYMVIEDEA